MVNDTVVNMQLWDTEGKVDYKKLRPLSYPSTDVFLICFSLVSPESLENVENMWIQEIKEHCPNIPYVLVGLKSDLRDSFPQNEDEFKSKGYVPISSIKGKEVMKKINARGYIECSAMKSYNLNKVFEEAAKIALDGPDIEPQVEKKKNPENSCCLLI